jgi:hypothetical protein
MPSSQTFRSYVTWIIKKMFIIKGKLPGKQKLGRTKRRREDIINIDLIEIGCGDGTRSVMAC